MNQTVKFSCMVSTTNDDCPLSIKILLDDEEIYYQQHVKGASYIEHTFSDHDAEHNIKFIMQGKTQDHTVLDSQGCIVSDARLEIKNFSFNELAISHPLTQLATYTHDFNGTAPVSQVKFYGEMGCNGTVELVFYTPLYLWLLENT